MARESLPIGFHVSREWGRSRATLAQHLEAAHAAAAAGEIRTRSHVPTQLGAAQVFLFQPRKPIPTVTPEQAREFAETATRLGIRTLSHSSYIANPWSGKPLPSALARAEQRIAAAAGCEGVVVHLGRPGPETVVPILHDLIYPPVVDNVTYSKDTHADRHAISEKLKSEGRAFDFAPGFPVGNCRILLEPSGHVSEAKSVYHTPGQLGELLRRIREGPDPQLRRVGLCVDTAHLWANGVDIAGCDSADAWVAGFEEVLDEHAAGERGVYDRTVLALHINDSLAARGSGKDAHASLLTGTIWGGRTIRESGLSAFLGLAARRDAIAILERKPAEELAGDLNVVASWAS